MPMKRRELEELSRKSGAKFLRHGSRHDIWIAPSGELFQIPRHDKDVSAGVENKILRALGLK